MKINWSNYTMKTVLSGKIFIFCCRRNSLICFHVRICVCVEESGINLEKSWEYSAKFLILYERRKTIDVKLKNYNTLNRTQPWIFKCEIFPSANSISRISIVFLFFWLFCFGLFFSIENKWGSSVYMVHLQLKTDEKKCEA